MTREEAIEILKDLWRTKHSTYFEADIRKALEMAIQALEQEPYDDAKYHEEHGEVVVAKEVWEDARKALLYEQKQRSVLDKIKDEIKMVKIIDAYRRHGAEWCSCCQSDDDTKRIRFSSEDNDNSGVSIVLCAKCRDELINLLQAERCTHD